MFESILVVCVGNICRSPMAEYLLRERLRGTCCRVTSAGLGALVDRPMDATAAQLLGADGVDASDASGHRARQVTPQLLREADLILVMEESHLVRIRQLAPEVTGKTFLLDKWVAARDIPDPYRQSRAMFERVHAMIAQAVQAWLPYLTPSTH